MPPAPRIRRGGISCRPKRPPRNGKRHETEGRMRCGHYRGGVAEGEGKKRASFWRHLMAPAGAAAHGRDPLTLCHSRKLVPDVSNRGSSVLMNPVSLCSCRGGISCRPKRRQRNGQRHGMAPLRRQQPPRSCRGGISCRLLPVVVGAASHAARRGRQETERRKAA